MHRQHILAAKLLLAASPLCALTPPAVRGRAVAPQRATHRIAAPAGDAQVVTLAGNVSPLARPAFAVGEAPADTRLNRMLLLLKPSAAQQVALDHLLAAQQDPHSPLFHRWLTPAEYGARFGASASDVARVAGWLARSGFLVNEVAASRQLIVFSGTAGQVTDTFHTAMRSYRIHGAVHLSNAQDPQIPASLAGVVRGVVSLNDFRLAAQMHTPHAIGARPQWNLSTSHYLFPQDLATIYDVNPLYASGNTGSGVSIAIAGRSNILPGDVAAFRAAAGLMARAPSVVVPGADPGLVSGDQDESTLDVEWAGAVAPSASIELVAAASTSTSDGIDLASAYIVNHALAPIVSVSYASCERDMGATELAFYNSLWEQAASQGMSVFVASGDSGAAGCDAASSSGGTVAAVNGLCSSPYATCVGGTEFAEGSNPAQYWSSTNSSGNGSATGYIPETVWNESAANGGGQLWASGGGASIVYPQPNWQAEAAGAAASNGMRAVPDVSLASASHDGYVIYENGSYWIVSGTSAATPSFAALMGLVVQAQNGVGQGNANPALYGMLNAPANPFHVTPTGNNTVPGVPGFPAAGADYNLATGLGSVDANVLVSNWGWKNASPMLAISAAPSSLSVLRGGTAQASLQVTTGGSFQGSVTLSISGLPAGVTASWSANPVSATNGASGSVLTLSASPLTASASVPVQVTAQGDGLSVTCRFTLTVQQISLRFRGAPSQPFVRPRF